MRTLFLCITLLAIALPAAAQDVVAGRAQARALRVSADAINIDGRLDEQAWQSATPIATFIQKEPVEGAAAGSRMEVRFVFDDDALYVGARMWSSPNAPIQAPLSRRDDGDQAENLQIELDTYLDRRTAYMFGVTAAGVRLDHYHPSDSETVDVDLNYDPVWRAETAIAGDGWTAELWIPFSQLRFTDQAQRVWGLNIKRYIPNLQEEDYWAPILRTQSGWASRFGELRGIDGVRPKARLEVLPYTAGSSKVRGNRDARNPFDSGANAKGQVGADVKVGVGSNLTLDATINPDFGQVEADPAEVNLSVTTTFFPEQRSFFREGENLLNGSANQFYYSRRIGAPPTGPATGEFVDYPTSTTILGAAKLTGRLASGTSLGFLGAITGAMDADVAGSGMQSTVLVAPRASWGIGRITQQFGRERSTFSAGIVAMDRDLHDGDPLASLLTQRAVSGSGETTLRFGDRTYETNFMLGFSRVMGTPAAIERIQRNTVHLFQSPDREAVHLDPTHRTMDGLMSQISLDKVAGQHWLWGSQLSMKSPGLETNDTGRLNASGEVRLQRTSLTYRERRPNKYVRAYSFALSTQALGFWGTFGKPRTWVAGTTEATLRNFWNVRTVVTRNIRSQDWFLTRGGPTMGTPRGWKLDWRVRNATTAKTRWQGDGSVEQNEHGDSLWSINGTFSFRPAPRWQLSLTPNYSNEYVTRQYVTSLGGGLPRTFDRRYIFGLLDRTTLSSQVRVSYTFKPDVTLDVYAEPFAASGRYDAFGELERTGSQWLRIYGTNGTAVQRAPDGRTLVSDGAAAFTFTKRDFNIRSFRSNMVLRWEWRPGSTLFVVWQQDRNVDDGTGDHVGAGDLFSSLSAPGNNTFVVKTTIWVSR